MAVKTLIEFTEGIYFITFTCQHWLPLFELTNSYDSVYKWFDYLSAKGHNIKGYLSSQTICMFLLILVFLTKILVKLSAMVKNLLLTKLLKN